MKIILSMLILLLFHCTTHAEEFNSTKDFQPFLKDVTNSIAAKDMKEAFNKIKPYWLIPSHEIDGIIYQYESQVGAIEKRFGKCLSMEYIGSKVIGKSFQKEIYLQKFEKHAMMWSFTFYKPKDKWIINSVFAKDLFEDLYEDK